MIASFRDTATEDLFNGRNTKAARAALPRELWRIARDGWTTWIPRPGSTIYGVLRAIGWRH